MSFGYTRSGSNLRGFDVKAEQAKQLRKLFDQPEAPAPKFLADLPVQPSVETPAPLPQVPEVMGYTGNTCNDCGGVRMFRAGHCEACADCGSTTGCS